MKEILKIAAAVAIVLIGLTLLSISAGMILWQVDGWPAAILSSIAVIAALAAAYYERKEPKDGAKD